MPYYISPPPQGPLSRVITAIIAAFVLVGSLIFGLAALLVVVGVGLIAGLIIWIRVAWIKRRLRQAGMDTSAKNEPPTNSGNVIDAEYTVISSSRDNKVE